MQKMNLPLKVTNGPLKSEDQFQKTLWLGEDMTLQTGAEGHEENQLREKITE